MRENADPKFPLELLPMKVASYCWQLSKTFHVDESFAGLSALAVAGGAMGNAFTLELRRRKKKRSLGHLRQGR